MGSIIRHRIDYNGVGALRGQRHTAKINPSTAGPLGIMPLVLFLILFSGLVDIVTAVFTQFGALFPLLEFNKFLNFVTQLKD